MSDDAPRPSGASPVPPPYRPAPSGPPPSGPPPSGPPPSGPPPGWSPGTAGRRPWWRRRVALITAGVVVVALIIGGAFAAHWYFHTGAQPAEALPADTLAYAAIDLDPNGQQKLAAHSLVKKFPASTGEDVGSVGDARQWIAEEILRHSSCHDLSYDSALEPWLGSRAAIAAVEVDGQVQPVIVLQSTDDAKADSGMKTLSECGGPDFGGWKVHDGWIVFAPEQSIADSVVSSTGDHSLADDSHFKDVVGAAGGTGVVTAYVAKAAAEQLVPQMAGDGDLPPEYVDQVEARFPTIGMSVHAKGDGVRLDLALKNDRSVGTASSAVGSLLDRAPAGSSAALAIDLKAVSTSEGMEAARKAFLAGFEASASVDGTSGSDELDSFATRELGAPLDKVLDDVLDSGLVVALGPTSQTVPSRPEELPIAGELVPSPAARDRVLGYYRSLDQHEDLGGDVTTSDDGIVAGTTPQARDQMQSGGGLTGSSRFGSVVDLGHDPVMAAYVDLQSGLAKALLRDGLQDEDPRWLQNLSHLDAVGLAGWDEGDYGHVELKVAVH